MSKRVKVSITQDNLETLRCSVCTNYLSCAPICATSDGDNICSQCTPTEAVLTCRQLTLEALLSDTIFPCRFQQNGCTTELLFNHALEHEAKCAYRLTACFAADCEWTGHLVKAPDHFITAHHDLVKQSNEFELDLQGDSQEGLILIKNNGTFLVKYVYNPSTYKFEYDIRCFTVPAEGNCKISVTNVIDPDYNFNLKGSNLALFSNDLFSSPSDVNLEMLDKLLNYPKTVTVAFLVAVPCALNKSLVNYDVIDSLKCKNCQFYLVPPLYDVNGGIVCQDCHDPENSKPSTNEELLTKLSKENFPCRWHGCEFVTTGDCIREHESQCKSRIYDCILSTSCRASLNYKEIKQHAEKHHKHINYFSNVLTYNICLNSSEYENDSFTIANNEVVLIRRGVWSKYHTHVLLLKTTKLGSKKLKASVYFEHDHCKYKSKHFTVTADKEETIRKLGLPACFSVHEQLTGNLIIE